MSRETTIICGLLLLAVGLVFGQTVGHEFINLDDDLCVSENPWIHQGFTAPAIAWAFTTRQVGNWDPLTWLSHMADWRLFGPRAGGHHLANVLLHAVSTILLFLVLRQMTGSAWASALAAALWAIHPLRVESVAWVTERKDVLGGLFFVLTLAAYVCYARRPSLVRYSMVMILFAAGLLSKPVLVTLPCVLLLLDYWPLGRMASVKPRPVVAVGNATTGRGFTGAVWRLILEKLPLMLLAGACCAVTLWAQRVPEYVDRGPMWRIGNAVIAYVAYLGQFFYPVDLALLYPRRPPELPIWQVVGAAALLAGVTAAAFAWRRKFPYLLVGWLWYLIVLLPMVGLVPFGNEAPADRFTYLPQIGLCIAVAWAVVEWGRRLHSRRWLCGTASVLAIAVLMGCAWQQTSYWRDSETLWKRTLACTSNNYWAHTLLGNTWAVRGRTDEAVEQFQKSLAINPNYAEAHFALGVAAAGRGHMDEAEARYRKAIAANPTYANAYNNLGHALLLRGRFDEAVASCRAAVRIRPNFPEAFSNLATALFLLGRYGEAAVQYERVIVFWPDDAEAHYFLGLSMAARGRFDVAAAEYRKALKIKPDFPEAQAGLEKALNNQP